MNASVYQDGRLLCRSDTGQAVEVVSRRKQDLGRVRHEVLVLGAGIVGHAADIIDLRHIPSPGLEDAHHLACAPTALAHHEQYLVLREKRSEQLVRFLVNRQWIAGFATVELRQGGVLVRVGIEDQRQVGDDLEALEMLLGVVLVIAQIDIDHIAAEHVLTQVITGDRRAGGAEVALLAGVSVGSSALAW